VGDGAWIGKVVDASVFVLGHQDGGREEIVEDGVGVGNVHHTLVLSNLSNKVTPMQVVADWHSKSEDESIGVVLHDLLNMSLGLGVERAVKVGLVSLEVSRATNWVCLVVGVDATGGEDGDVNASLVAAIGQVESTDNIISDGLLLVILTPIDIWTASRSSCVKDVGGLDSLQLVMNGFSVLHANCRGVDLLALALKEGLQVARNPPFTTPDEEDVLGCHDCDVTD